MATQTQGNELHKLSLNSKDSATKVYDTAVVHGLLETSDPALNTRAECPSRMQHRQITACLKLRHSKDSSLHVLSLIFSQKAVLQMQDEAKSAWMPVSTARCYLLTYQDQSSGYCLDSKPVQSLCPTPTFDTLDLYLLQKDGSYTTMIH